MAVDDISLPCWDDRQESWFSSDDERSFKINIKKRKDLLQKYGWVQEDGVSPVPINYSVNGYNFRDEEIDDRPDTAIAIGCSCTFGVGMHRESTWPYLVEQAIQKKVWNLGVPAGGYESCFRALELVIATTKSKEVFLQTPSDWRREILNDTDDPAIRIGSWNASNPNFELYLADREFAIAKRRTLYAILGVCQRYGAKLYLWNAQEAHVKLNVQEMDRGRDLIHPGHQWHSAARDAMLDRYGKPMDIEAIYAELEHYESYKNEYRSIIN